MLLVVDKENVLRVTLGAGLRPTFSCGGVRRQFSTHGVAGGGGVCGDLQRDRVNSALG